MMENPFRQIDVCMSPLLYPVHENSNAIVVLADVVRASSTICTAFKFGAESILPLASKEETLSYKAKNYLTAGERESYHLEGFDLGNSPYEYMTGLIKGRKIAFTSTNGTQALSAAIEAKKLVIGCFLNFDLLINWLLKQSEDVLVLCSGWKNNVNIEDTLFAGKLAECLLNTGKFSFWRDSVSMALSLNKFAGENLHDFVLDNSPRLKSKLHLLGEDIEYCLRMNQAQSLPMLKDGILVNIAD